MCSVCPWNACGVYGMWCDVFSVCVVCVDGVRACGVLCGVGVFKVHDSLGQIMQVLSRGSVWYKCVCE